MFLNNESGLYPSILLHRSNFGQLAIGGAMINRFWDDSSMGEAIPASGGWITRFDGGSSRRRILDLPCDMVAMYVEGLIHIYGAGGGDLGMECDSIDEETAPWSFALVVSGGQYIYLWSRFSFSDRITNDGVYDLKEAYDIARGRGLSWEARRERRSSLHYYEFGNLREWYLVRKKQVPSHIRQILHRTINTVKTTVSEQFGQGKKFFALPSHKR